MAQTFDYRLGDALQVLSEEEIRELYRFPREITFILTREEYDEVNELLWKRDQIEGKLRDLSSEYDLTDRDSIRAYTKAYEESKQTDEYKAIFPIIDRLEEIEETAVNRYSQTFNKPEDLYDAVAEIVGRYSLTLYEEQQRKSLFVNTGGRYRLPELDFKPVSKFIKIDPIPKHAKIETIKEEALENARLTLERTVDIQTMELVCKRRRWSLAPLERIVEARASALIAELDLGIESYSTVTPDKYVQPADKISNELTALSLMGGGKVFVGKKGSEKITSVVRLDTQGLEGLDIRRELEEFDRAVMDAITTLYLSGNEYMTISMIHNVLTGNSGSRVTDKKRDEINDSITRLILTGVVIRPDQEREAFYPDLKPEYDSPLVNGRRVKNVFINGTLTDCLRVYDLPILYEYANIKGQVSTIPIGLLNSPVSKNKETIVLQDYMLRRIEAMKKSNVSHTIIYDTVYKLSDIFYDQDGPAPAKLRVKQQDLREKVKTLLDFFKREKYISGYSEKKKGGKLYGIEVKL